MSNAKVPLYQDEKCIGRVSYTDNLDQWDGNNYTGGGTGSHLGIGKTRSGQFYICHGTQWEGQKDYAEVVTEMEARELVMSRDESGIYRQLFGEDIPELD